MRLLLPAFALALLAAQAPPPLSVPPGIQQQRLIVYVAPEYPKLAKAARIEGTVRLAAMIDENGEVDRLRLISGHPLLVKAAFDAVKQWRYRPALREGVPVSVATTIDVAFSLGPRGRDPSERLLRCTLQARKRGGAAL